MSRKTNPYREELKIARSQRKRLQTMNFRITDMATEWDGVSGAMECGFNMLAEDVKKQLAVLDEQIADWAKGVVDGRQ